MTGPHVFWSRVRGLLFRRRRDADLDSELQAHLDLLADDYVRRGWSPVDARAAARRDFGGVDQVKETYRDQRGLPFVETALQDVRYGARLLRRAPGFTVAAVTSLALAIGATCAMFIVVNVSLLADLPVHDPDRLVAVIGIRTQQSPAASSVPADWLRGGHDLSYPIFRDLARDQRVLSEMAGSGSVPLTRLKIDGETQDITGIAVGLVSANYFSMLGLRATAGRLFGEADSRVPGEGEVAVISHRFGQRRFGRNAAAVGRRLEINGTPFTIVGVAPRGFFGERIATNRDIWIPLLMQPRVMPSNQLQRRTSTWFRTLGRLAPGVTEDQAAAELTSRYQQLKREEIATGSGSLIESARPEQFSITTPSGTEGLNAGQRRQVRQPFLLLLAATGLVLLIACCNIANLLIARGTARQREIAIRLAIGSSRRRLVRQLLTESLLLSVLGGGLGLLLAFWSTDILVSVFGLGSLELTVNRTVVLFGVAVSLVATMMFGLLPALQVTAVRVMPTVINASLRQPEGAPRRRIAKGLVVLQVGLSIWLLIGAALLVRTLQNLRDVDVGVDREAIAIVSLQTAKPFAPAVIPQIREELSQRLARVPGVAAVAFAGYGLFGGGATTAPVRVPDSAVNPQGDGEVRQNWVSAGYFQTLGMTLARGRNFDERDTVAAPAVAVLNETFARHYFGDADPVGKTIYFPSVDDQSRYIPFERGLDKARPVEVVGVVRDARFDNLRDPVRRMAYQPIQQRVSSSPGVVLLRVDGAADVNAAVIRQAVNDVSSDVLVWRYTTVDEQIAGTMVGERTVTTLLGVFSGLALVLACVGLYGVMAFGVARRTAEIGVRMALGASRPAMVAMVLRETMVLVVLGVGLGVPAALATTRLLQTLLFNVTATDPSTIASMVLVMLVVAAAAGGIPASRAARVDPVRALRFE